MKEFVEIVSPFKSKQKLFQMLICALVFIGMAVPFKVMVLIEGLTEVRPVNAVPVVVGLLFGPAGAWGCAIGNLIADFFGTFSKGSILGFIGNFVAAWLPYKLWYSFSKGETPNVKSYKNLMRYILISAIAAIATAIIIACGLDLFFDIWLPKVFWIILFNDFGFPVLLGLPVLIVLTSEDIKMEINLPAQGLKDQKGKGPSGIKYGLLVALLVSEAALLLMIYLGMQMSESPLMLITSGIFTISLLGFVAID